ncbi:hypothetical protein N7451_012348 [Penicillium sp. IBT 35674x]|nr:hypothetical protein N7451_012348 [Penicillium sp. IBT 35674x]
MITNIVRRFRFGFQPWHSAIEFKRAVRQYLREFHSLSILGCLDITGYYQHESIYLPIYLYLREVGVDFHFDMEVTSIEMVIKSGEEMVSRLDLVENGFRAQKTIRDEDTVIIALGSTISGTGIGTNDRSSTSDSIDSSVEFDENWALWLEIGNEDPKFGNPYNFCTRQTESTLETFTITTADSAFFSYLMSL